MDLHGIHGPPEFWRLRQQPTWIPKWSILQVTILRATEFWRSLCLGRLGQTFLLFFGRGTGPKRSGAVLACFWSDFQPEPSILDPIRAVFDDFGPGRHFGGSWPGQGLAGRPWDQPRDWPGGPGPAHTFFFSRNADLGSDPFRIKKSGFFIFSRG